MPVPLQRHNIARLGRLEFLARSTVEGFITGLHKSPFHGFSVEFAEHRQYNPGESTRHMDWKLFARTEKLFLKRFEEETNLRAQLVLDVSSSMWYPSGVDPKGPDLNKIKFSIYAAASLMELFRRQRDAIGLSLFGDDLQTHTPARSSSAHHRGLIHLLEDLLDRSADAPAIRTSGPEALHAIAEATPKRALIILFSDMFDGHEQADAWMDALQHMRHNKHEVVVFQVLDETTEGRFDFDNRPTVFRDLETGDEVRLHPEEVRSIYLERMNSVRQNLRERCAQNQIDLVEVDIQSGLEAVLSAYLLKRQRMRV